jgi:hypothetical protein
MKPGKAESAGRWELHIQGDSQVCMSTSEVSEAVNQNAEIVAIDGGTV